MIKVRIEGKDTELAHVIDLLLEEYNQDVMITGVYELPKSRSRAYIDIDRRL